MNNIQFDQVAFNKLTDREIAIASASLSGLSIEEIGKQLNVAPSTVGSYRTRIMEKLQCSTFIQAVGKMIKKGIL